MRKRFYIPLIAAILIGLLYFYGRSLWHPYYVKLSGGKSVSAVVERIQEAGHFVHDLDRWDTLHLLCFKEERVLEVWGSNSSERKMIKTFDFTGFSGELGPKLKEGDGQIPEGLYKIEYLNPNSSYHLSMKINYPNEFDRDKGAQDGRSKLGYDIFIHGKSVTIGCIPIGDAGIEELFLMVAEIGKEQVQVIISPYDMRIAERAVDIPEISWETELYDAIGTALKGFKSN
ncbi:MAG: L,D-transpeptidase family protein [Opitutaceae bacterium]